MKILIIKPSSFGDIVQSDPALVALREFYPEAEISWLVFDIWADIIDLFPEVNKKIVWHKKGGIGEYLKVISGIRKENYDLVLDLQGLMRTAIVAALSGARRKLGVPGLKEFSRLILKEVYPEKKRENAALRNLEVIRFVSGKTFEPKFNIRVDDATSSLTDRALKKENISLQEKLIAMVPSARGRAKQWSQENFSKLIDLITSNFKNIKIIILGGREIEGLYRGLNVIDFSGKTTIKSLAAILKRCSLLVGLDTGPSHLGASLGVPAIMLFGGSDVKETSPISENATILKKDFNCSPCRGRLKCRDIDCMKAISPEEVFEEVKKWIK